MATEIEGLAFGLATRGDVQEIVENSLPNLVDAGGAVDDVTTIDVHIFFHAFEHRCVCGELYGRCRLGAKAGATSGCERYNVGPTGDLSCG